MSRTGFDHWKNCSPFAKLTADETIGDGRRCNEFSRKYNKGANSYYMVPNGLGDD